MARFLVLYRGGDASKLTPKQDESLMKKWMKYMDALGKSGALQGGARVQSSAAAQIIGKEKTVKAKRAGNHASYVGGYNILEAKSMKAVQTLSKRCPHLTLENASIEILPILEME